MTTLGSAIISRGSEWRKWDLHFHSPLSGLNNQFPKHDNGEPDWEPYLGALEALTDISVLGITDYFSIEGYSYVYEARKNGRLKNIALILPNIEFRLNKVIVTGNETKRLNYHVLFFESVPPEVIDEHFLQNKARQEGVKDCQLPPFRCICLRRYRDAKLSESGPMRSACRFGVGLTLGHCLDLAQRAVRRAFATSSSSGSGNCHLTTCAE